MRKLLLFFIIIGFALSMYAQVSKSVTLVTAGTLSSTLTTTELSTVTNLTVSGIIDARDFKTMRDFMPFLAEIDMSGATIVAYTGTEGTEGTANLTYPANTVPNYAFYYNHSGWGKTSLTSVKIPSSVTSIGSSAFSLCSKLASVWFISPTSLTTIGDSAFYCTALNSISIPASVTSIGSSAFDNCVALTLVSFASPSSLTTIGDVAFEYCKSLTSIRIPASVTSIGNRAFHSCSVLASVWFTYPSSLTTIGNSAFEYCSALASIDIPASVTLVGNDAFSKCSTLASVLFASTSSLTTIGNNAFFNCTALTSISIPASVTSIGSYAFFESSALASISFVSPSSIKTIGNYVFYNCTALTSISVPASVTSIGNHAFDDCTGLTSIYAYGYTPVDLSSRMAVFFHVNKTTCTLIVPPESIGLYAAAYQWKDFFNIRPNNQAPIANAGVGLTVISGTTVTLDGSASSDADGDTITYMWTSPAGITLSTTTSANPTFTAPAVSQNTNYLFSLVVNDGKAVSQVGQVTITVTPVNTTPVANAGLGQTVTEGTAVTLDGSASTDFDGDTITYMWTSPAGITLSTTTSAKPTFTAPMVSADTLYSFTLVVNDGNASSTSSQVIVLVKQVVPTLTITSRLNNVVIPVVDLSYQLFKKSGNSFIEKKMLSVIEGNVAKFDMEQGEWIVLVSPKNASAFTPTYSGNVENQANAELISISESGTVSKTIDCLVPTVLGRSFSVSPFRVYPNPATETATIDLDEVGDEPVWMAIYGIQGIQVIKQLLFEKTTVVNLTGLVSGFYLIKVSIRNKTHSMVLIKKSFD